MFYTIAFSITLLVICVIGTGIYIRYLPFCPFIAAQQITKLKKLYGMFLLSEYVIISFLVSVKLIPLTVASVKIMLYILWIPFLLINFVCIPSHVSQHIFAAGLQFIYAFLLHTVAGAFHLLLLPSITTVPAFLYAHLIIYLILFLITFQAIRYYFTRLFITYYIDNYYWSKISFFPFFLFICNVYLTADRYTSPWHQLSARIIFGICTICLCYCFTQNLKWLQDRVKLRHNNQLLLMQINSIQDQVRLLEESKKALALLRHDMRHHFRILYSLIQTNHKKEALGFIKSLEENMQQIAIHTYCQNILINAVLSVYITKFRQAAIPLQYDIVVPARIGINETDLAAVVSNLLENAFQASEKQPPHKRRLQIDLHIQEAKLQLMVKNQFDPPVLLGSDGLPVTLHQGHGFGMRSLASFAEKYKATIFCKQEKGWFYIYIIICKPAASM